MSNFPSKSAFTLLLVSVLTSFCLAVQAQNLEESTDANIKAEQSVAKEQIANVLTTQNENPPAEVSTPKKSKVAKALAKKTLAKKESKKHAENTKAARSSTKKSTVARKSQSLKPSLAQASTADNSQHSNKKAKTYDADQSTTKTHGSSDSQHSSSSSSQSDQDNSSQQNQSSQPNKDEMPNYPSNPSDNNQSSASEPQKWAVKIGSFSNAVDLKKSIVMLQNHGFDGFIKEIKTGSKVISEVYVGPTKERTTAEKLNEKLKESHIPGQVVPTDYDEQV